MSFFQLIIFIYIVYITIPIFRNLEKQIIKELTNSK